MRISDWSSDVCSSDLPALIRLIERTQRLIGGALAVISGRPLKQIDACLLPLQLPGAGQHGAELRVHGNATPQRRVWPGVEAAAEDIRLQYGRAPAMIVVNKGESVALHYCRSEETKYELQSLL